jgi:hypothetical protein
LNKLGTILEIWFQNPMEKFRTRILNDMTSSMHVVCPLLFFLALMGCKEVTHSSAHVSQFTPHFTTANSPTNQVKNVAHAARQIVITNTLVVGTNHAYLARLSPEARPFQYPYGGKDQHYYTETNLANQIAYADHIVVSFWGLVLDPIDPAVRMLLSGDAAKQVVQAVSCALYGNEVNPGWIFPDGKLQFYMGTNQLASVSLMWDGFTDNDGSRIYTDYSGVLGTLEDTAQAAAKE